MDCVCTVSSTGGVLSSVTIFHASGTVLPGKWSKVLTAQDVGSANSPTANASQEAGTNDWWSVAVVPSNGSQTFIFKSDGSAPWAEAEVPRDGSVSFVIGSQARAGGAAQIPITIKTWHDRQFSKSDGNVDKTLVSNYITPAEAGSNAAIEQLFHLMS